MLRHVDELLALAGTDKSRLLSAQVWIADTRLFEDHNSVRRNVRFRSKVGIQGVAATRPIAYDGRIMAQRGLIHVKMACCQTATVASCFIGLSMPLARMATLRRKTA